MNHLRYVLIGLLCLVTCQRAWADNWDQLAANQSHQEKMKRELLDDKYRFYIREAMDLACYVYLLNSNQNNSVEFPKYNKAELVFENDIDLDGHTWRGISEAADGSWQGSIDGRGHTIRNMHLGNNKHWSGLIDVTEGETSVKNLHFVNCDNNEGSYDASILVGSVLNKGKMTVENVTFENCTMNVDYQSGFICGLVVDGSTLDIKNVSIKNCTLNSGGIKIGAGIGFVQNSTIKATDVRMEGITVKGNYFVGGFIGKLESNCKMEIDHMDVSRAHITSNEYQGGIIGEWQGTGWLKNSRWEGELHSSRYKECGGLVGKFEEAHTSVTIENCVADVRHESCLPKHGGNIGGVVGFSGDAAAYTILNTTVLANSSLAYIPTATQGMLVGNSEGSCHITIENCHIDDGYNQKTPDIRAAAFGSNIKNMSNLICKNITSLSTLNAGAKPLYYIAQSNEMGSRLGIGFTPLTNTDDMVVRYKSYKTDSDVESPMIPYSDRRMDNYVMVTVGSRMTYNYKTGRDKWIVEDLAKGVKDSRREDATHFSGMPSDNLQEEHKPEYLAVEKPRIAITESNFDRERQTVVLKWTITNQETTDKYWSKDGYWTISRDGETIADSIPYNTTEFVDETCPLGKESKYRIDLVSPNLKFYGNQEGDCTVLMTCQDNIHLRATVTEENTRKAITTMMPNSKRFDGSRVSLYRITNEDIAMIEGNIASLLTEEHRIASTTYAYQAQSEQSELPATLYDESNQRPCTMFHYFIVCDQFKDSYYQDRSFTSNDAPIKPMKSVSLTTINTAKGESTDKVKIDWTSHPAETGLSVTYKIWRKKYDPSMAAMTNAQDTEGWVKIYEVTNTYTTNSYTDQALPGYVYKYKVRAYVGCDGVITDEMYEDELTDIGYTASRGTIMGSISFSSSKTNVEGVDVRLAADSLSMTGKGSTAYARYFSGKTDRLPLAPGMGQHYWKGNWTIQFLLRPLANTEETRAMLHVPGMKDITLQQNSLCIDEKRMPIKGNDYTQIILCHEDGEYRLGYAETPKETNSSYVNWVIRGTDNELGQSNNDQEDDMMVFGATEEMTSFQGMLDEVRLWNTVLNERQIRSTYDRYLTGNESNLTAYYTFDSGVVEYAFDESHPEGIWNKHHTTLPVVSEGVVLPGLRSDLCPSEDILCYRGTTDHNGEYQIAGIPFTGEGTNYMVVPIFGTHEFMPSATRRYVSAQSLTHNSVNFTDISSFPVEIQAYYALGNYPAEGLSVLIDNTTVTDKDGKEVVTDVNGRCIVSVPVGKHRLYLAGFNHNMVNEGYPCSIDSISSGGIVTFKPLQDGDHLIDFQASPVAPLTFYDNTYARVAGRVVGGTVESVKPLGANLSHANIGQVSITLEPSVRSGYNLNNNETRDVQLDQHALGGKDYDEVIESTTTYLHASSDIVIKTDPSSGEFLALIPPVSMRIKDIHTTGEHGHLYWEDFNTGNQSDLITIEMKNESKDSITVNSKGEPLPEKDCHSFHYHAKKVYTYFVEPEINVINPSNQGGLYPQMLGDSVWVNRYEEMVDGKTVTVEDKVALWNPDLRDGSPQSYLLQGLPVFTQGDDYDFDISLFERYHNCDTGRDSLYFIPNVEIKIDNDLATQTVEVKVTNGEMEYAMPTENELITLASAANGKTRYTFSAGFPNPLPPYTLDMSMSYTTNGKVYTWPAEGTIKGIVTGHVNVPGTDFVTAGPDQVSFVLRDPPGGGSSAWIEQGSTISTSGSYENVGTGSQDMLNTVVEEVKKQKFVGTLEELGGELFLESTSESNKMYNTEFGISTSWTAGTNKSAKITYTTNQKLSTNSGPTYVGSQADLYVGMSTNFVFSKSRILGLRKSSEGELQGSNSRYALEQYDGVAQAIDYPTMFCYSQRHILQELIPDWRNLRRSHVDETVSSFTSLPQHVPGTKPRYYVLSTTSDKKDVWEHGVDYVCVFPNSSEVSVADTIGIINNQIHSWQLAIEDNERIKVETMRDKNKHTYEQEPDITTPGVINPETIEMEWGYMGNTSYDAGASLTQSITRETNITKGTTDAGTTLAVANKKWVASCKFIAWGKGFETKTNVKEGYSHKGSDSYSTTEKQTFGYTLADSKTGNYYSIDTWLPGELNQSGTLSGLTHDGTPKLDEFFVFRLCGGQSKDPYEPEEYTLFYKEDGKPVKIGDGTIAIEAPKVTLEKHVYTDIPNGQKFTFPITLSNTSTANVKVAPAFNLCVEDKFNPDGLKFSIDGVPVPASNGYEVFLMPGQSMQKLVEVEQSRTDITHYENITFNLVCSGEPTRYAADTVSFHYKPASSPVRMTLTDNVVNSTTPATAAVFTVSDYQPTFENFTGIRIQYKDATETNWHTATVLVNDSARLADLFGEENFPDVWQHLDKKNDHMRISIPMDRLADGTYTFRAQSFSPVGKTDEVTTESDELNILKDTASPSLLTHPTPEDGFYTGRENISIEMNEPIDMALLTEDNFSVTGVLNDAEVRHMSGLHFDGNTPARTQSRVNVFGKSSAIAFWYKPQVGNSSCLLSQQVTLLDGTPAQLALFYNNDATLTLQLGSQTYKSTRRAIDAEGRAIDDWMYATIIIDREMNETNVFNLFGTSTQAESHFLQIQQANVPGECNVPLYVGGSQADDECHADMEELVLYDGAQTFATVAAYKGSRHNDHLNMLAGYWPMDEGDGMTATDKVRNRSLTLQGTDNWYLPVTNYAVHLDGKSQYIKLHTENCPISNKQDYALEFHFRTTKSELTDTLTLFSNGWGGAGSPEPSVKERLSLSLDRQGQIIFSAAGNSSTLRGNFADRNWHHLALIVERYGYARVYVDGNDISGTTNMAGNDLGGLANATMTLGALVYTDGSDTQPYVGHYFEGDIDEVRLWNAHSAYETIKSNAGKRLTGNEVGLVAYYPFEHTTIVSNQPLTEPWTADCVQADEASGIQPASDPELVNSPAVAANGPRLKAAGIAQPVGITFTHNGKDRIILSFPDNLDKKRIEGCTLTFSVKNLKDMAGNKMLQPTLWNIYVEQKSIVAWSDVTMLDQEIGQSAETTLTIYNDYATAQRWTLTGLPAWLNAERTSSVIEPFSVQTVKLTTDKGTPVGKYSAILLVAGEDGLTNRINLDLNVTSVRPDWVAEENGGSVWMSLMGRLKVGDTWSTDENDMVAAFTKDGRCLGVASPQYNESMSTYFLHMNIRGKSTDEGKTLKFYVWDASTDMTYTDTELTYVLGGQTHTAEDSLVLQSARVLGNFTNPCVIASRDVIRQMVDLHEGWNWISLWVEPKVGKKASDIFADVADNLSEVKSRTKGYYPSQFDNLNISLSQAYLIYAKRDTTFSVEGTLVDPAAINITFTHPTKKGEMRWQWMGYPIHTTLPLQTAFSDFLPSMDDVVKSEDAYAMYNGSTWIGNLTYLSPGKGYMYGYHADDSHDVTWNYPSMAPAYGESHEGEAYTLGVDPYDYENYTFVQVKVDGLPMEDGRFTMAAIGQDDIIHGVAGNEANCFYLNIYGNDGEAYRFTLLDLNTLKEVDFDAVYDFDAVTPAQTLNLSLATGIVRTSEDDNRSPWYRFDGVRMGNNKPATKGIYIHNGKKQVNK